MNFAISACRKKPWLHKYVTLSLTGEALYERCVRCGKRNVMRLKEGNPHSVKFATAHLREFLIPQHRLFAKEYAKV